MENKSGCCQHVRANIPAEEHLLNYKTLFNFINKFILTEYRMPDHRQALIR